MPSLAPTSIESLQRSLLTWYDASHRRLPWRASPGLLADPYRVWLSEIMLQQTVVATVIPYFERFVVRWPTVTALAEAALDDVLAEWAGLGYYARARNLHKCAGIVARDHGGQFPASAEALLKLPGIGAYTAGAIAAIAFGLPLAAVDGNVERVTARLGNIATALPAARPQLRLIAESLVPTTRPGDFAQAMMDLGATICVPANPRCLLCPISEWCAAYKAGNPGRLPVKAAKAEKPTRYGEVYWAEDGQGAVLVRRRPDNGLLGGMIEFPSSEWTAGEIRAAPPLAAVWQKLPGKVRHTFSHFHLELEILATMVEGNNETGTWVTPDRFSQIALPSVMRKIASHAAQHRAEAKER